MAKRILLGLLCLLVISGGVVLIWQKLVEATDVSTSVTVGNAPPSFTVDPHEDPTSSSTSPTDAGQNVTFKATADDPNGEDWYLAVFGCM